MIIIHTYHELGWDERSLLISAIDQDLIDFDEIENLSEAIRNDEKFENLEDDCAYKLLVGRAYIDPGLRAPDDPGTPYFHIKYVEKLIVDPHEGWIKELEPSF